MRSAASCRSRDLAAVAALPNGPGGRRTGLLGRLARSPVPPGDRRDDRLPHDGLPRRSHHVHPAEAEGARSDARLRQRFRPADGADPAARGRAPRQGHRERRRREPPRLRGRRRRDGPPLGARRQAAPRRRDRRRPAGAARRAARPRARAQEPRHRAPAPRRTRPRALGQRLSRRLARGGRAATRRQCGDHRPRHRHRAHARTADSRLRLEGRRLGRAGGGDRRRAYDRVRRPVLRRQLPGELGAHPRSRQRGLSDRRGAARRQLRHHQTPRHGRAHHGRGRH